MMHCMSSFGTGRFRLSCCCARWGREPACSSDAETVPLADQNHHSEMLCSDTATSPSSHFYIIIDRLAFEDRGWARVSRRECVKARLLS